MVRVPEWTAARRGLIRLSAGVATGAVVLGLAACGGDSDTDAAKPAAEATTTAAMSDAGGGDSKEAQLAALTERPTKIAISEPIGKEIPKGKKIVFVGLPIGDPKIQEKSLRQATDALGWQLNTVMPTNMTPQAMSAAIEEALRQKADGIIFVSFPGMALKAAIGKAKAQGVPVVNINATEAEGSVPGIVAQPLGLEYLIRVAEKTGEMLGLMVEENSTVGEAALLVVSKASVLQESTENGLKKTCSSCTYKSQITIAAQAKDYVPNMVNFIRKEKLKGLYVMNAPLSNGFGPAMKAAGLDPSSVTALAGTISAADGTAERVRKKEAPLAAGYVWPAAESLWYGVDAVVRALTDTPQAKEAVPEPFMVLPETIPEDVLKDPAAASVIDYQDQFKVLWGLN